MYSIPPIYFNPLKKASVPPEKAVQENEKTKLDSPTTGSRRQDNAVKGSRNTLLQKSVLLLIVAFGLCGPAVNAQSFQLSKGAQKQVSVSNLDFVMFSQSGIYQFVALGVPNNFWVKWDFGDGKAGNGKSLIHKYASSGYYQVTVTLLRGNTPVSAKSKKVHIKIP